MDYGGRSACEMLLYSGFVVESAVDCFEIIVPLPMQVQCTMSNQWIPMKESVGLFKLKKGMAGKTFENAVVDEMGRACVEVEVCRGQKGFPRLQNSVDLLKRIFLFGRLDKEGLGRVLRKEALSPEAFGSYWNREEFQGWLETIVKGEEGEEGAAEEKDADSNGGAQDLDDKVATMLVKQLAAIKKDVLELLRDD